MKKILSYSDIFIFNILLFIIEFILRYCVGFSIAQVKPILINILALLIIDAILINVKYKFRKWIESIILIIITLYSFAQSYHFAYFDTFFSITKITVLKELNGVKNEIFSKLSIKYVLYLIPLIIWLLFIRTTSNVIISYEIVKSNKLIKIAISISVIFLSLFATNNIFEIENKEEPNLLSEEYLYHTMTNKNRFLNRFGTLTYIYKDIDLAFSKQHIKLSEEDKLWIENYCKDNVIEENKMIGIFEGKNLILILGESLCNFGIDEQLTPTLYKMQQYGFFFDNYYAPIYQSATNDSEFISLTSNVPSIDFGTTSKEFGHNHFPYSLPNLFREEGYSANSYHSFFKSFYDREPFHESLGFSRFYDRDDLEIWRDDSFDDFVNWTDDKVLMEKTLKNTNTDEPFFDFVISASGHMPYMDLREELYDNFYQVNQVYDIDSESAFYLASQMKLDQAMEYLINELDKLGILDDTVICIYGDHYPYGIYTEESMDYIFGNNEYDFEKYRVPLFIYNSAVEGETIHKLGSTFDIYPTLCNMFNLKTEGAFVAGNDLFSSKPGVVLFPDSSFITDDLYYDGLNSEAIYFGEENDYQDQLRINNELFKYSQLILKSDYFK